MFINIEILWGIMNQTQQISPLRNLGLWTEELERNSEKFKKITHNNAKLLVEGLSLLPDPFKLLDPIIKHNRAIAEVTKSHKPMDWKTAKKTEWSDDYINLKTNNRNNSNKTPLIITAPNAGHNKTIADYNSNRNQSLCELVSKFGFAPYY